MINLTKFIDTNIFLYTNAGTSLLMVYIMNKNIYSYIQLFIQEISNEGMPTKVPHAFLSTEDNLQRLLS